MTCKTILRTTLAAFVALSLVAVPAAATTVADRPPDSDRTAWSLELSNLLSSAWGLLFGGREGGERDSIQSVAAADECESACEGDAGAEIDPDG